MHLGEVAGPGRDRHVQALQRRARRATAQDGVVASRQVDSANSNVVAVELCQLARARRLCLFHHEPVFDDAAIEAMLAETRRLEEITRGAAPLQVSAAYDGLEILL